VIKIIFYLFNQKQVHNDKIQKQSEQIFYNTLVSLTCVGRVESFMHSYIILWTDHACMQACATIVKKKKKYVIKY